MKMADVSWNHTTLDMTLYTLEVNPDTHVIYVEGDDEYDEHIGLTIAQAEDLIINLAVRLAELYEAQATQTEEADESRGI